MFLNFSRLPLDPIFQLLADYNSDTNPNKVNLGIGLYADFQGAPVVLETVKKAFLKVDTSDFNYQPISGNRNYLNKTAQLVLPKADLQGLALQSTCGGTQAIRMFADMVELEAKQQNYQPNLIVGLPTWGNHLAIFRNFNLQKFNHLTPEGLPSLENHLNAVQAAPEQSVLLMHGGATHNPTGQNLSLSELLQLSDVCNQKQIKLLIDSAYFGFGSEFEQESAILTSLFQNFQNFALAFSYSKNASLYEHRTGVLIVKTPNKDAVESQLQQLARESISMAPGLGQEIMLEILSNNLPEWQKEVAQIRENLDNSRNQLVQNLPSQFAHLGTTAGMFGLLPFTPEQIEKLKIDYSIYLPSNSRINIAGVNPSNIDYLLAAFSKV